MDFELPLKCLPCQCINETHFYVRCIFLRLLLARNAKSCHFMIFEAKSEVAWLWLFLLLYLLNDKIMIRINKTFLKVNWMMEFQNCMAYVFLWKYFKNHYHPNCFKLQDDNVNNVEHLKIFQSHWLTSFYEWSW